MVDLLFITFQTYLPYESSARVDGLTAFEAPLRASENFQEALTTLRSWWQEVITVVNDLGGNPEPLKLLSSLRTLISSLVSSDNAFATEVAKISYFLHSRCTDEPLLQTMAMMEIELAAHAQEDWQRTRQGLSRRIGKEHEKERMRH